MDRPIEGNNLGLRVWGNGVVDPSNGLCRKRFFNPGPSEIQHINPPEEVAGENPSGISGNGIVYHLSSYGSNRYALVFDDEDGLFTILSFGSLVFV